MERHTINPGDTVAYAGPNGALKVLCGHLTVLSCIPDGCPVGNGETNRTGNPMYLCRKNGTGTLLLFRKEEIRNAEDSDVLRQAYLDAERNYRSALVPGIKRLIRSLTPESAKSIDISQAYKEELVSPVYKFWSPKDWPGDFRLDIFQDMPDNSSFLVTGVDDDDDTDYTFDSGLLTTEELMYIHEALSETRSAINRGDASTGEDGTVNVTAKEEGPCL